MLPISCTYSLEEPVHTSRRNERANEQRRSVNPIRDPRIRFPFAVYYLRQSRLLSAGKKILHRLVWCGERDNTTPNGVTYGILVVIT